MHCKKFLLYILITVFSALAVCAQTDDDIIKKETSTEQTSSEKTAADADADSSSAAETNDGAPNENTSSGAADPKPDTAADAKNVPDAKSGSETAVKTDDAKKTDKKPVSVVIQEAQKTEYRKNPDTGSTIVVLTGGVKLSVTQDKTQSIISADSINYERDRKMLYAEGNVVLEKSSGGKQNERLTARSLLLNTETQEGVFDDGRVVQQQTDAINLPSGSTLIVAADVFGRDDSGTVTFKDGTLTFCEEENPHWKIKASRIWLLPGNEFAFFNALLYIGRIPTFYLPFFYYPKDEMIFNPVFNYDKRRGYSIQTTTYILGRKQLEKKSGEDSFFDFMRPSSLKEQVREGLFLHNLDEDAKASSDYLKIYADMYSNLGIMTGVAGVYKPKNKLITDLQFTGAIAVSQTLTNSSSGSTGASGSYIPEYDDDGNIKWDKTAFFGIELPFRYLFNFKTTLSNKLFNATINMPLYSDQYFNSDFMGRSESMDWISFLTENPVLTGTSSTTAASTISSYSWTLSGALKPEFAQLKPYVSTLALTNISSSLAFSSKQTKIDGKTTSYFPDSYFYYPNKLVPVKVTLKASGTLFSYPAEKKTAAVPKTAPAAAKPAAAAAKPAEPAAPAKPADGVKPADAAAKTADGTKPAGGVKQAEAAKPSTPIKLELTPPPDLQTETAKAAEQAKPADSAAKPSDQSAAGGQASSAETASAAPVNLVPEKLLPQLTVTGPSVAAEPGLKYSLTYSITPTFSSEINYHSYVFNQQTDINLANILSSFYSVTAPAELSSSLNWGSGRFSLSNGLKFTPFYQAHPDLKEDDPNVTADTTTYSDKEIISIKKTDYGAFKLDLVNTNSLSYKPFASFDILKDTSLSWNSTLKLIRTSFTTASVTNKDYTPSWNDYSFEFLETDDDGKYQWDDLITAHTVNAVISAKQNSYAQSVTLQANMWPLVQSYLGRLSLTFPFMTFAAQTTLKTDLSSDTESDKLKNSFYWEPFTQSSTWNFFDSKLKLTQSFKYNMKTADNDFIEFSEDNCSALTFALTYSTLSLSYSQQYTNTYTLESGEWTEDDEQSFVPYSLNFSYSLPSKKYTWWKNRITFNPGLKTAVMWDFIRRSNSYFTFSPSVQFEINKFLKVTFSSESRNSKIYGYFPGGEDMGLEYTNIFEDLLMSFAFWDGDDSDSARAKSSFKLKSLSFKLEHDLHDWTMNLEVTVKPTLYSKTVSGSAQYFYDISPDMSLSVVWRPLESMKTKIKYDWDRDDKYEFSEGTWLLNPAD